VLYRSPLRSFNESADAFAVSKDNRTLNAKKLRDVGELALHMTDTQDLYSKLIFDFDHNWDVVLFSDAFALALIAVWLAALVFVPKALIWLTILALIVCFAVSSAFCYGRYKEVRHSGLGRLRH